MVCDRGLDSFLGHLSPNRAGDRDGGVYERRPAFMLTYVLSCASRQLRVGRLCAVQLRLPYAVRALLYPVLPVVGRHACCTQSCLVFPVLSTVCIFGYRTRLSSWRFVMLLGPSADTTDPGTLT